MIYKFKSQSTSDVIMLGDHATQVLGLLGKTASPKGIIEVADMPHAIARLEQAIAAEDGTDESEESAADDEDSDDKALPQANVSLRQRAWPLLDMMKRSMPEGHDIVWGV